jgi:hypothetical protein
MARIAATITGVAAAYELSVVNVDKPPLDEPGIRRRAAQFLPDEIVWLTRSATFVQKAGLFPGATFAVGADTLRRIADTRYYAGSEKERDLAIETIVAWNCRFLVFGRWLDGEFWSLDRLNPPPALRAACTEVPESKFRFDLSSTELRRETEFS